MNGGRADGAETPGGSTGVVGPACNGLAGLSPVDSISPGAALDAASREPVRDALASDVGPCGARVALRAGAESVQHNLKARQGLSRGQWQRSDDCGTVEGFGVGKGEVPNAVRPILDRRSRVRFGCRIVSGRVLRFDCPYAKVVFWSSDAGRRRVGSDRYDRRFCSKRRGVKRAVGPMLRHCACKVAGCVVAPFPVEPCWLDRAIGLSRGIAPFTQPACIEADCNKVPAVLVPSVATLCATSPRSGNGRGKLVSRGVGGSGSAGSWSLSASPILTADIFVEASSSLPAVSAPAAPPDCAIDENASKPADAAGRAGSGRVACCLVDADAVDKAGEAAMTGAGCADRARLRSGAS